MTCRIRSFVGIVRIVALAMIGSSLLAGCGTTSLFRDVRPVTLASVQFVTRCEGLGGPEAERALCAALSSEIQRRGLLRDEAGTTRLGIWLSVAERIHFTPEGCLNRYDCAVIIASAKGGEAPEKVIERNFSLDFRHREYSVVKSAIVNRLGDLVEEAAEKI